MSDVTDMATDSLTDVTDRFREGYTNNLSITSVTQSAAILSRYQVLLILPLFLTVGLLSTFGVSLVIAHETSAGVIEIAQQSNSTEQETIRTAAAQLSIEAGQLRSQGTVDSLREAAIKYEAALSLWRQVSDRSEEASTLYYLGGVYSELGDEQKALNFYRQALLLFDVIGERAGVEKTRLMICRLQNLSSFDSFSDCERR